MVAENVVLKFSIACSRSRPPFHPTRSTPSNTPSLLQPSMHNVPLKRAGCAVTSTAARCLSIVCVLDMPGTACTTLFRPASPQGGMLEHYARQVHAPKTGHKVFALQCMFAAIMLHSNRSAEWT